MTKRDTDILTAPLSDDAREALKEKLAAIHKARRPLLVARQPLDDALRALDELHDAAVEEAGVELIEEACEGCDILLVVGDLGHRCADGPVLCEAHAPTWRDLLNQYQQKDAAKDWDDPEVADGLAAAQAHVDAGDGDKKHVWPL